MKKAEDIISTRSAH